MRLEKSLQMKCTKNESGDEKEEGKVDFGINTSIEDLISQSKS